MTNDDDLRQAMFFDYERSTDRLERANAADVILKRLGVPHATVHDVAALMRWADGYAQSGLDGLIDKGWSKPGR